MSEQLSALNRQAISAAKHHMGHFAWPTVLFTAATLVVFVGNLALFAIGVMPLWAAIVVYAVATYFSYTPLHEAAHGNIHGHHAGLKWVNDLCGYLVAPLIMVPYSTHTVEHFTHHRFTNQPDKDPDYVVSTMGDGLFALIRTGLHFLWVQNSFLFRGHWSGLSRREQAIYVAETTVAIGWRLGFLLLVTRAGAGWLLLLGYLAGAFFTAYWFAYRPHAPYQEPARWRNTNSLIMPRWMRPFEWFWLGQNLHSIHHLFPRVPFYRYHVLHRQIEPILRAHGTPMVGVFSRAPVTPPQPQSRRS